MSIAGIALIIIGILCCFIHKVPGPLVSFIGLLLVKFSDTLPISWGTIAICGGLAIVSLVAVHYLIRALSPKLPEYGKAGKWGTFVGSVLAVLFAMKASVAVGIILILVLPYVFALIAECVATKNAGVGSKRALGAYGIFIASTIIKIVVCIVMLRIAMAKTADELAEEAADGLKVVDVEEYTERETLEGLVPSHDEWSSEDVIEDSYEESDFVPSHDEWSSEDVIEDSYEESDFDF